MSLIDLLLASARLSIPLILAAAGGLLSERSGVANIAIEGLLLISAFVAAATAHFLSVQGVEYSVYYALFAGVGAAVVAGSLFAGLAVFSRADQIVIGIGFNLLMIGGIPLIGKALFGVTGGTPAMASEDIFSNFWLFGVLAVLVMFILSWGFRKARWGMRVHAAGESPFALESQGVSPLWIRFKAVVVGAAIIGLGGVYLSLCQGNGYFRDMAAGRGFIALAAVIFGGWRPWPVFAACCFFGAMDALQMLLQGKTIGEYVVPNQFIQIIPYLATIVVLIFYGRKISAPSAINRV